MGPIYSNYISISKFGIILSFLLYFYNFFVLLNFFAYLKFELQMHGIMKFGHLKNNIHDI